MVRFFADGGLDTYQTPMKCATQGLAAGVIKPFSKSIAIAGLVDAQVRDEVKALQKTVEEQVEPPFWSGGALSFLALTSGAFLSCSEFLWIAHRLGERYGFSDRPPLAETLVIIRLPAIPISRLAIVQPLMLMAKLFRLALADIIVIERVVGALSPQRLRDQRAERRHCLTAMLFRERNENSPRLS